MEPMRLSRVLRSCALLASALACAIVPAARAADHGEAPLAANDAAADIADLYAWHANGKIYAVVTYAGFLMPSDAAVYDEDVLYRVHIDDDADQVADVDVEIRFGRNGDGDWGIQVKNLPGAEGTITGAVGTTLTSGDAMVHAGLFDDPFFFDQEGFNTTLSTGTLSFDNKRDSVAGFNVMAIVLGMDPTAAFGGATGDMWCTTGRLAAPRQGVLR